MPDPHPESFEEAEDAAFEERLTPEGYRTPFDIWGDGIDWESPPEDDIPADVDPDQTVLPL